MTSPKGSMAFSKGKEQQYWLPTSSVSYPDKPTLSRPLLVGGGGTLPREMPSTSNPVHNGTRNDTAHYSAVCSISIDKDD